MASRCGWWRLCAIFSGSTCTIQNSVMAPIGTTMTTNHARYIAAVSIISGGRNDARAAGAKTRTAAANAARGNLRILFTTVIKNICAYSKMAMVATRYYC